MIKDVEYKGQLYEIDTTPENRHFATINGIDFMTCNSPLSQVMEELTGRKLKARLQFKVEDDTKMELVLHLGYKFSRSKAWNALFDWAYFRNRKIQKGE